MKKRESYKGIIFALAFLGFTRGLGFALNKGFTFPLLSEYTESAFIKGIILGLQGLMGFIIPILLGYMSDTFGSKHGRRKPFILAGGSLGGISALMIYTSFTMGAPLWIFTLVVAIFYFAMYSYVSQFRALLPDLIPSGDRGKVSGVITFAEWFGNLVLFGASAYFVATFEWGQFSMFLLTAVFLIAASIFTFVKVKEPQVSDTLPSQALISYLKSIFKDKNFLNFYAAQVLLWISYQFVAVFMFGIAAYILEGSAAQTAVNEVHSFGLFAMAVFNLTVLAGSLSGGYIYDNIGRRISIIIGAAIFGIPLTLGWFINTRFHMLMALLVAGIGWGAVLAGSLPVVGDLLTQYKKEAFNGRYYGVFAATRALPVLIASVLGGLVVDLAGGNYRLLFPIAAVLVWMSVPLIWSLEEVEEE
ncbi:MAG: MFS transporter [Candidatus Thermoplasmatota archaeon]